MPVSALRTLGTSETHAMETQVATMLQVAKLDGADNLVARAQALIESETAKLAAGARRRVVLGCLAELGYEVSESMATAWAPDGRLVVRKPGATDYGLELGAPSDVARLQVRLVGSDRPLLLRDAQRDRDMETIGVQSLVNSKNWQRTAEAKLWLNVRSTWVWNPSRHLALVSTRLGLADCPDFSGVACCNHLDCFFLARLIGEDVIWDR